MFFGTNIKYILYIITCKICQY